MIQATVQKIGDDATASVHIGGTLPEILSETRILLCTLRRSILRDPGPDSEVMAALFENVLRQQMSRDDFWTGGAETVVSVDLNQVNPGGD